MTTKQTTKAHMATSKFTTSKVTTSDITNHSQKHAAMACDAVGVSSVAGSDPIEVFNAIREEASGIVPVPMLSIPTPTGRIPTWCAPTVDTEITELPARLTEMLQTAVPPLLENLALPALWQFMLPPEFCKRAEYITAELVESLLRELFPELAAWLDSGEVLLQFNHQTDGVTDLLQKAINTVQASQIAKLKDHNAPPAWQHLIFGGIDSMLNIGTVLQLVEFNKLRLKDQDVEKIAPGEAAAFVRFHSLIATDQANSQNASNPPTKPAALAVIIGTAADRKPSDAEWPAQVAPWLSRAFQHADTSASIDTVFWNTLSVQRTKLTWEAIYPHLQHQPQHCQQLTTSVTLGEIGAATLAMQIATSASVLHQAESLTRHVLVETGNYPHYGMVALETPNTEMSNTKTPNNKTPNQNASQQQP